MSDTVWWLLVTALMIGLFAACFAVLLWFWSVSSMSRQTYVMMLAIGVFSLGSAVISINFANWLKNRYED